MAIFWLYVTDFSVSGQQQHVSVFCYFLPVWSRGRQGNVTVILVERHNACRIRALITGFYRATRMHSADYAVARCLSFRLSVCHTPVFYRNG